MSTLDFGYSLTSGTSTDRAEDWLLASGYADRVLGGLNAVSSCHDEQKLVGFFFAVDVNTVLFAGDRVTFNDGVRG